MLFKHPGPVLSQMNDWYRLAASLIGVEPDYSAHIAHYLEEAGFVDIQLQVVKIAIGEWPENECELNTLFHVLDTDNCLDSG